MSWLLVALIPGLLMVVTVGLQRLEAGLNRDTVSATDVAKFLQHAEPADVDTLARTGMSRALDGLRDRRHTQDATADFAMSVHSAGLPTRAPAHPGAKSEFRQSRHADRV